MKVNKLRIIGILTALCLIFGAFMPYTEASAKTLKESSKEYKTIDEKTGWMIFQVIYNLFQPGGTYEEGKKSFKLTKDDYKTVLLSHLIDGNREDYTKSELKDLSVELFGKSYVDSEFLSYLSKDGNIYHVSLGDAGPVDFNTDNMTIKKKNGYIYISGDYTIDYYVYEESMPLGKVVFKFKKEGSNYTLKGAKFTPAA